MALNGEGSGVAGSDPSSLSTNTSSATTSPDELSDGGTTSRLAAVPPTTDKPLQHGDRVEIESNGAHIFYDASRRKWATFDNCNLLHGWRGDKALALEHAERLPRGDPVGYQQHPFSETSAQSIGDEPRRDNQQYMPRASLTVTNSRGRKRRL